MTAVLLRAADVVIVAGVVVVIAALARRMRPFPAIRSGLELWLAATLLRVAAARSWSSIAAVAAIVIVRRVFTMILSAREERRPGGAAVPG